MTKAEPWANANIFFPLCTKTQTPQHSLCWHAGPQNTRKYVFSTDLPGLIMNRFCISHESTDVFPVVLLLLKCNGLIWKWLMSVSEYVLCLLWNWISFVLHCFLYKFKVYMPFFKINFCCIYRRISRIFFSLNRVAQVGLRQEFKNVLLNHLNNSEVSEGESGVVSSKKLSTEPKICAKGDKKILVSQFPPRSHPESDDSCWILWSKIILAVVHR